MQRPLQFLRWFLLDILNRLFPPEKPTEEEYIAYLRDKERQTSNPLESPAYIERIRTQEVPIAQWPCYPNTEPIRPIRAVHLRKLHTYEMPSAFPVSETDKWTVI